MDGTLTLFFANSGPHFYNLERYEFSPNLKVVDQKLGLPRPSEVKRFGWEIQILGTYNLHIRYKEGS